MAALVSGESVSLQGDLDGDGVVGGGIHFRIDCGGVGLGEWRAMKSIQSVIAGAFVVAFFWFGMPQMCHEIPTKESDPNFYRAREVVKMICSNVQVRYRVNLTLDHFDRAEVMILEGQYLQALEHGKLDEFLISLAEKHRASVGVVE